MAKQKLQIFTVSQINAMVRGALESGLPGRFVISGEISDWKQHYSSGHCYFSLKDEHAQMMCVMWASKFKNVKFVPENGLEVQATGYIDIYPPQGKLQFYAEKLERGGVGVLQQAFEKMVEKLEAQGLFNDEHKQPLPRYPMRIGLVTSESGAAIKDIADSIYNRWPCARLLLCPVRVQGEGAAEEIAEAIALLNARRDRLKLDVLIVGRGGGSLEDLWAFNQESVARAIFASKIPVISAVGHERDVTIADLVADARASTPTKAGVISVPDRNEVLEGLAHIERRLVLSLDSNLRHNRQRLETILASYVFRDPLRFVEEKALQIDDCGLRMTQGIKEQFRQHHDRIARFHEQVRRIEPGRLLGKKSCDLQALENRANKALNDILNRCEMKLTSAQSRLTAMNPRAVLNRGYSLTTDERTGRILTRLADVQTGADIITEIADGGKIFSLVRKTQPNSSE